MTVALSLTAASMVSAAKPEPAKTANAAVAASPAAKPARQCLTDLNAFQKHMQKYGYWRGASDYSYGYPMYGYAYDAGMPSPAMNSAGASGVDAYWSAHLKK